MYACDFETRNDRENCSVWHWGYAEIGNVDNWSWGIHLEDFIQFMSKQTDTYYFHNAKFDCSFILSYLLENGYTYNDSRKQKKNTFKLLMNETGVFYSLQICFDDRPKKRVIATIYDSFKKLPFKLEKIAKDLQLPILKGSIDYNKERPYGYEPTEEEITYLENDVKILALALELQFDERLTRMTIGSDCLYTYTEMLGKGDYKKGKKKFRQLFPLLHKVFDDNLRKAYRGGWTYLHPKYANIDLYSGIILDVNSEYPWAMRENPMPFGVPVMYQGQYKENSEYPLYVQQIKCQFELKENHLPTIQIKDNPLYFKKNEYVTSSKGMSLTLHLSNIDLALFLDHYDIIGEIKYVSGFMFRASSNLYNEYIDYFMQEKENSNDNPTKRLKAKLLMNNLYGKTGSKTTTVSRIPYLDKEGVVRYKNGEEEELEPVYIPTAIFTTAYARDLIIRTSQANYDRFIYCDTDSMHLTGTEVPHTMLDNDMVHPTKLGKFDLEHTFDKARYLFQKTYMYRAIYPDKASEVIVKGAGMTEDVKKNITFDNFRIGVTVSGSKKSKVVKGGTVIEEGEFTLKERTIRF